MLIHITGDSLAARAERTSDSTLSYLLSNSNQVVNTAKSGDSSGDLLERLEDDVLSKEEADVFILLIGANDLATHKQTPLTEFEKNIRKIIHCVKHVWSMTRVLLITPPAVDEEKQRYRTNYLVQSYGQVLKQIASDQGLDCLDFYELLMNRPEPLSDLMEGVMDDGLHFGLDAYQILADAIQNRLSKYGPS